jgi:hypothetical protein
MNNKSFLAFNNLYSTFGIGALVLASSSRLDPEKREHLGSECAPASKRKVVPPAGVTQLYIEARLPACEKLYGIELSKISAMLIIL